MTDLPLRRERRAQTRRTSVLPGNAVLAVVLLLVLAAAGAGIMVGASVWFYIFAAALPWFAVVRARVGGSLALAAVAVGIAAGILYFLMLSAWLHLGIARATLGVGGVVGLGGIVTAALQPRPLLRTDWRQWTYFGSGIVGAAVWLGEYAHLLSRYGSSAVAFVTSGDGANNVIFTNTTIQQFGIIPNASPNPLAFGYTAIAATWAHVTDTPDHFLRSDFYSFATTWAVTLAFACVLTGVGTAVTVRADRPILRAVAGVAGGFLPLLWLCGGMEMQFGFWDTVPLIPLLSASWIAFVRCREAPALSACLLLFAGTAALAVWGPLAVLPLGLGIPVAIINLRRITWGGWVAIGISVAQLVWYGFTIVLKELQTTGHALSTSGSTYSLSPLIALSLAGIVIAGAGLSQSRHLLWGSLGALGGMGAGLGYLVYLNRHSPTIWMYYPQKTLWLSSVALLFIAASILAGLILNASQPAWAKLVSLVGAAAILLGLNTVSPGVVRQQLVPAIAGGQRVNLVASPSALERAASTASSDAKQGIVSGVVTYAGQSPVTVLWNPAKLSVAQAHSINFWALQLAWNNNQAVLPLHNLSYTLDPKKPADLCQVLSFTGPQTRIVTGEANLRATITSVCKSSAGVIVAG